MKVQNSQFSIRTGGKGLTEISREIDQLVQRSGVKNGQVTVLLKHTSASLVLMENADPTASRDLERWFDRLVPEDDPDFIHTHEGPDDMPSHIRMTLTRSSEVIPIVNGRMDLGTWQGIFVFEHRDLPHQRSLSVVILGE